MYAHRFYAGTEFLALLDPEATDSEEWRFIALPEKTKGRIENLVGPYYELKPKLEELNQTGYGICVTVNQFQGDNRKTESLSKIRAIYQDDDNGFEGDFPLEPSLVVSSSQGKSHRYWFVDDWPTDDQGKEDYLGVMQRMVESFGCDPNAKDLTRPLRLPGYLHLKGSAQEVKIVGGNKKRYSKAEVMEAFPPIIKEQSKAPAPGVATDVSEQDLSKVKSALEAIPADIGRKDWISVGMGLHWAEAPFEIWDEWSQTAPEKYNARETVRQWKSFTRDHHDPVTLETVYGLARKHGWRDDLSLSQATVDVPTARRLRPGGLTGRVMTSLLDTFRSYPNRHRPSPAQWMGLKDLASHLEAMADGTAEKLYYLSSLDPGVGKTQTIKHFAKELLKSPDHHSASVLICVGRLAEIQEYVNDAGLGEKDFAVYVEKENDLNALGNPMVDRARVLFTTQQMLVSRTKRYGSFEGIKDFWYNGRPRSVRIWDEACLPARPITIDLTLIEGMTNAASKAAPQLYPLLTKLTDDIRRMSCGGYVDIPDFATVMPVTSALHDIYDKEKSGVQETVRDLWTLSGKTASVGTYGIKPWCVHYENTLPDDLKPMVICDASGRVSQTYPHWSNGRGDLVELSRGSKNYKNLTLHYWPESGGKTAWLKGPEKRIEAIASAIQSKPDEQWLVVHHMKSNDFELDIPAEVIGTVGPGVGVHFAHWGGSDFKATNEYRDIPNIILAGTLFYPEPVYEAIGRLSRGLSSDDKIDREHLRQIKLGEHADHILQAVCRGSVRKSDGEFCHPCDVYIIGAPQHGIPQMLKDGSIFPGATAVEWVPFEDEELLALADWISSELKIKERVASKDAMEWAKYVDRSNFQRDVLNNDQFEAALGERGIILTRQKGRGGSYFQTNEIRMAAAPLIYDGDSSLKELDLPF